MVAIRKIAGKAANLATETVGEIMGSGIYPETDQALAAYLFERIAQAEKDQAARDRDYYLELMGRCLETVRKESGPAATD